MAQERYYRPRYREYDDDPPRRRFADEDYGPRRTEPRRGGLIGTLVLIAFWLCATLAAAGIAYRTWLPALPVAQPTAVPTQPASSGGASTTTNHTTIDQAPVVPDTQAVVVVPAGAYHSAPTSAPVPTEVSPELLIQGATTYALLTTPPTPFPTPVCDATHAAFVTDPIRVLNEKGIPIGSAQGWSCDSQAAAVASAQSEARAMIAQSKAQP